MRLHALLAMVRRYGPTSISAASISAAHLIVQLVVLHALTATEIGILAFMLTVMQLAMGASNALIAAPYSIFAHREDADGQRLALSVLPVNIMLCLLAGIVGAAASFATGSGVAALCFGFTILCTTLRWFGRTDAITRGREMQAAASDLVYAVALVVAAISGLFMPLSMNLVSFWFVIAATASLLPLLPALSALYRRYPAHALSHYRPVWRDQARWALAGVATTEATNNCHVYLVVAFAGPAAFAPIAIGALFLRPLGVCLTAITQIERPRMARDLHAGNRIGALKAVGPFRIVLFLVWLATMIAAAVIVLRFPHWVAKPGIDPHSVLIAVALSGLVGLLQCAMTPWSTLLQAADRFRSLAMISVQASIVTVAGVAVSMMVAPPIWSLIAVIAGQAMMAIGTGLEVRRWRHADRDGAAVAHQLQPGR